MCLKEIGNQDSAESNEPVVNQSEKIHHEFGSSTVPTPQNEIFSERQVFKIFCFLINKKWPISGDSDEDRFDHG